MGFKKLKTIAFLLCVLVFCDTGAQDLTNIRKQKPVDFKGSLAVNTSWYVHGGKGKPRNDPFNWSVSGTPTLTIYGISFPFSFLFSSQNRSFTQPFNQYGMSPTYKWITLHAGYRSIFFSPYTLAGASICGAGIELKPGILRFGAMYGRLQKAVKEDTTRSQVIPAYKRMGYSVKIGIGNSVNYLDFIGLYAWDEAGSLSQAPVKYRLAPEENEVFGISGSLQLFKRFIFQFDAAGSAYTNDTRSREIQGKAADLVRPVFNFRGSSQLYTAGQTSLSYSGNNFGLKLLYKRIDPDYKSMGSYYFQSDLESYTIEPSISFWKQKVRLGGSLGLQHDNLMKQRSATTDRTISSLNLSFNPVQQYGLDIQYANYGIAQKAGIRPLNDTSRLAQANLNVNVTNRLSFANKVRVMTFMLMTSYQKLTDLNQFTSDFTENQVIYANLNVSVSMIQTGLAFNAGLIANNNEMSDYDSQMFGPSAGVSMDIIKKKLSGSLNTSYLVSMTRKYSSGGVVSANLGLNYRPIKRHAFNLNINMMNNNSGSFPDRSFTEFRINAGYHFYLK